MYAFFFFNDTAPPEIYTLSLHDALPISSPPSRCSALHCVPTIPTPSSGFARSEEHTSELQSQSNLVCRLLLEKKKYKPGISGSCHRTISNARLSPSQPPAAAACTDIIAH